MLFPCCHYWCHTAALQRGFKVNGMLIAIAIHRYFMLGNWINRLHLIRKQQYNSIDWNGIANVMPNSSPSNEFILTCMLCIYLYLVTRINKVQFTSIQPKHFTNSDDESGKCHSPRPATEPHHQQLHQLVGFDLKADMFSKITNYFLKCFSCKPVDINYKKGSTTQYTQ